MTRSDPDPRECELYLGDSYRRFGELTAADARSQAAELAGAGGWGPLAKVAGVAQAWRDLASELDRSGVDTVAELEPEALDRFAHRLWVLPPRGGFL